MRYPATQEEIRLIDEIRPYIISYVGPVFKKGTPQEIIEKQKKLVEIAFERRLELLGD